MLQPEENQSSKRPSGNGSKQKKFNISPPETLHPDQAPTSMPQIRSPHYRITPQGLGAVFTNDLTRFQNIPERGNPESQIGILLDEENGDPPFLINREDLFENASH